MKRMKILATFMVVIMALSGCGNTKEENSINTTMTESNINENVEGELSTTEAEDVASDSTSPEKNDIDSKITEKDDSELDLKSYYYSMEDKTVCNEGEDVFGSVSFQSTGSNNYVTTSKVPIYAKNGVKLGYTKENVVIIVLGIYDDWCYFDLNGENKYARLSDIEANSITVEERDAKTEEETKKQEESSVKTETPVENIPVEQPGVETLPEPDEPVEAPASNKYTPDEAIAVFRAGMEAGGMSWNPEIKDVVSWGTGFLYLDKGYPEWAAETNLESAAIGGHGGNSWTEYYLEVTGSDEECVYYTIWSD